MELLAAIPRAAPVHLDHIEILRRGFAEGSVPDREGLGHEGVLGAGVDVLDDGVFLLRIKGEGPDDDAMDVELAGAVFGDEAAGGLPTRGPQLGIIGFAELGHFAPIAGAPQQKARRQVHPRKGIDEVLAAGAEHDVVRALAARQRDQAGAIEVHAVDLTVVRIFARIAAEADEGHLPRGFVDMQDRLHHPCTRRHGVERGTGAQIHPIQMRPTGTFRHP